ncbi:hypothetical protein K402DRAFT_25537 [Aulographum hederae CBS 113979]|uniref:Uncharacterized protein n=1 Tax=Aulographum hederae CBS 113979 TaxID=1176131 RepID=A0A6G1H5M0_9PEZI|nr:hypothetical protein K402DRAFT_25537 [Aulographum hederae CBS 113979]
MMGAGRELLIRVLGSESCEEAERGSNCFHFPHHLLCLCASVPLLCASAENPLSLSRPGLSCPPSVAPAGICPRDLTIPSHLSPKNAECLHRNTPFRCDLRHALCAHLILVTYYLAPSSSLIFEVLFGHLSLFPEARRHWHTPPAPRPSLSATPPILTTPHHHTSSPPNPLARSPRPTPTHPAALLLEEWDHERSQQKYPPRSLHESPPTRPFWPS